MSVENMFKPANEPKDFLKRYEMWSLRIGDTDPNRVLTEQMVFEGRSSLVNISSAIRNGFTPGNNGEMNHETAADFIRAECAKDLGGLVLGATYSHLSTLVMKGRFYTPEFVQRMNEATRDTYFPLIRFQITANWGYYENIGDLQMKELRRIIFSDVTRADIFKPHNHHLLPKQYLDLLSKYNLIEALLEVLPDYQEMSGFLNRVFQER